MVERITGIEPIKKQGIVEKMKLKFNQLLCSVFQREQIYEAIPEIKSYTTLDKTGKGEMVEVSFSHEQSGEDLFNIIVRKDKKVVSEGIISVHAKPYPHFILEDIKTVEGDEGRGYARVVMTHFESFLKQTECPGFLLSILGTGDPADGMYEKSGWEILPMSYLGLSVFSSESYDKSRVDKIMKNNNY